VFATIIRWFKYATQMDDSHHVRLVFISHSGKDTWVAKQIAQRVSDCGATPFLDKAGIDIGADFEETILAFLQKADEFVVVLTPWALDRPYVWVEAGVAWMRHIPVIALLLGFTPDDVQAHPRVPVSIKKTNLIELDNLDVYLDELRLRAAE